MKKLLTLATLLAAVCIIISGCKKSASVNGLVATDTWIQTNTIGSDTFVTNYSYDAQNRLTEDNSHSIANTSYTYSTGQVTVIESTDTIIYTLNTQGLAVSDNKGYVYAYDGNGYLTSKTNSISGYAYISTISGGNLISLVITAPGLPQTTYNYTYLSTPDYRNFGKAFLGKSNVNLVNSEVISSNPNSAIVYTYSFDSKGRVQSVMSGDANSSSKNIYTYLN